VAVSIAHPRPSDLNVRLVAPDGRAVTLFNRQGGVDLTRATFAVPAGTFAGASGRGLWSVQVFDLAAGATGVVNGVSLTVTPQAAGQATATGRPGR
jgi:subtilisin-like proprotein convertase family protein